ncbi:family 16 glycoside hydrolase [Prevotella sp. 10(H)]|uniref:family 16 glycoside hydrolase n=1 Tax=Prevotella sp. 10(H) TaxID=1158294 RepID=UPI0018CC57C5|nr:family 16 glycoside hydrolase [Prevotella sp. 10(H)]
MKKLFLVTFISVGFLVNMHAQNKEESIIIDVDAMKVENTINPLLYGSGMEDVNHEVYGGFYDQRLYGESFEEGAPVLKFDDFTMYDAQWKVTGETAYVYSTPLGKLIYDKAELSKGWVEMEIRFDNIHGTSAGFILHADEVGEGFDNFNGYEFSLSTSGRGFTFGKHMKDWKQLGSAAVNIQPTEWNKLRVNFNGAKFMVYLNEQLIFAYEDTRQPLLKGKVGLRATHTDVGFRNLKINDGLKTNEPNFSYTSEYNVSAMWRPLYSPDAEYSFALDSDAYNGLLSQTIENKGKGKVGVSNKGLNHWGISVRKGQRFQGRIYLKGSAKSVFVALQNENGTHEYARMQIKGIGKEWQKHDFKLTSAQTDPNVRFAIYIEGAGKVWIDQAVLTGTGKDQFKGLPLRNDIGQAFINQGLTFLRYGGSMINSPEYRFKKMLGDPDKRPQYRGNWYQFTTNGFGIVEFMQYAEAAGFIPSFAVNIEETPEDMADMIEYFNGPVTSQWGRKRAQDGHPKPYGLKYIQIGNEELLFADDREGYRHYIERFNLLYDAMTKKDPDLIFINSAWWRPESKENMEMVFRALDGKAAYWDYHPWVDDFGSASRVERELKKMKEMFLSWNPDTNMKCAIFEENGNSHNIRRTLGHIITQNAVRRMGDFVLTSCPANALEPYKQNDNGWNQGQIFFTPSQVWGMPPYYAQQMASRYHQPLLVSSFVGNNDGNLDVTATRSEDGNQVVLHLANTGDKPLPVNLKLKGFENIAIAKAITLSGSLTDVNTPEEPEKITPIEEELTYSQSSVYVVKPYSYTILVYSKK